MHDTPKGLRLHIGLFGRRNVGKSSILNAITRQDVSIVSEQAGTTTDPVEKPMEMLPLGPVLFIDTAGLDDEGALGKLRINKTRGIFDRTDVAIIVCVASLWGEFEESLLNELNYRNIPTIVILNKIDIDLPGPALKKQIGESSKALVTASALTGDGIGDLRQALLDSAPDDYISNPVILADLVGPGNTAVLVIPIDKEAPKGRLILPQVQSIRDLLDHDCSCVVVKENGLRQAIENLKTSPKLVVTDSQAFEQVAADTPPGIPLTGFSILYSRFKGDLAEQARGAISIGNMSPGDRVLIAEACTHHPITDDIGREKIPRWMKNHIGGDLEFVHVQGHDFPDDLSPYKLVILCGACMQNRREVLNRILQCNRAGVPVSNYGIVIAYLHGILERSLAPFPGFGM